MINVQYHHNGRNDGTGENLRILEYRDLSVLPPRDPAGNKGTFGKLLVIAGSKEICGAAFLAAESALRTGIGMVRIYTEEANRIPLASLLPEALLSVYRHDKRDPEQLSDAISWSDGILIGPGLGTDRTAKEILRETLRQCTMPIVLDADAVNLAAADPSLLQDLHAPAVLTPHMGEMSRLIGAPIADLKADPVRAAADAARDLKADVILKDDRTVTACRDGSVYLCISGCDALASAGSGDVLAGITAGLFMRYPDLPVPASALAPYLHGLCGMAAAGRKSRSAVTAGDLSAELSAFLP